MVHSPAVSMQLNFRYDPQFEYENFKAAFASKNHADPSPRQKLFFARYSELTREHAHAFSEAYLAENHIDPDALLATIRTRWETIADEFFRRADKIFGRPLPMDSLTVYLTIHDRCSYNFEQGYFFIHTNIKAVTKTLMHELWHWYYFANFGDRIRERYGSRISNDLKEALTVLLNEEFSDLMPGITDVGYPQHQALRERILSLYRETHNITTVIDGSLTASP